MSFSINFPSYGTISISLPLVANLRTYPASDVVDQVSAIVSGGTAVDDGNGGIFTWSGSSTATDDGVNFIAITGLATGRWIKTVRTGATGAAATVTVGTVTTGTPGSSVAVTNSGSTAAATLNFTIPRGDVGATGATGDVTPAATAAATAAAGSATAAATSASAASTSATNANTSATNAATSASNAATSASAATTALAILPDLQNSGGMKNLFPDPFFTSTSLTGNLTTAQSDQPFVLSGAWDPISNATSQSPYPAGRMMNRPSGNVSVPQMIIYFDNIGLAAGDVFQIVQEMFLATGATPATSGDFCIARFIDRAGLQVGSDVSILTPTSGNPLNTTCKSWNSGSLTIPTNATGLRLQWVQVVGFARSIVSFQIVKIVNGNTAPTKPLAHPPVADLSNRLTTLEAQAPGSLRNGVMMRRSTYASATTAYPVGTIGAALNGFSNNSGYGQSFLAAACPAGGFNMITTPLNWTPDAVFGCARIEAVVRTCATGSNPMTTGKTIAVGYIDVDPTSGTATGESIQLFDPVTGDPKTVMPSDLLALMGIGVMSVNSQGNATGNTKLFITYATHSNADPALIGYQASGAPTGYASMFTSIGGANSFVPQLTLAVSPVTAVKTPSATFASAIATLVDEPPAIIALPKVLYAVVGREASIYYDAVQHRDAKRTNFTTTWTGSVPSGSGGLEERIKYIPTAAATNTLTLAAYRGDLFSSSATCAVTSVAASAASGTRVIHCIGDSLIQNGGMLTALRNISLEAGSVTALTFIGSAGTAPLLNDGYSGKPLGAFRGPTIVGTNPFYNPGTSDFDYAYWMANTGASFAPADFVFIEAGGVDVGSPTSDAAAQTAATAWAATAEFIAASIHSANPTAKIVFYTKEAGPVPGQQPSPDPVSSYGMLWRIRRNWRILAAKQISQFSGRSASNIYVSPTAAAIDPETGWNKSFEPRNASVTRTLTTYATYAAMVADLTKGAGTLAYCTDVASYFVKVGGNGLGRWRDVRVDDGFVSRYTDTVHYSLGAVQVAEANWAVIKALG